MTYCDFQSRPRNSCMKPRNKDTNEGQLLHIILQVVGICVEWHARQKPLTPLLLQLSKRVYRKLTCRQRSCLTLRTGHVFCACTQQRSHAACDRRLVREIEFLHSKVAKRRSAGMAAAAKQVASGQAVMVSHHTSCWVCRAGAWAPGQASVLLSFCWSQWMCHTNTSNSCLEWKMSKPMYRVLTTKRFSS